MEEVGELSSALRSGAKAELAAEFADVLAWLATLANIAGVDLDAAVRAKYGGGCPGCGKSPCVCDSGGETMNREQGTGNREQLDRETPMAGSSVRRPARHAPPCHASGLLSFCSLFPVPCSLRAESPPHIETGPGRPPRRTGRAGVGPLRATAPGRRSTSSSRPDPTATAATASASASKPPTAKTPSTTTTRSLPALAPNQDYLAVAYIRPGDAGSDFTIQLVDRRRPGVQGVPRHPRGRQGDARTPRTCSTSRSAPVCPA